MKHPLNLGIEKKVVFTFLCSDISRKNQSWILSCSLDCINAHIKDVMEQTKTHDAVSTASLLVANKQVRILTKSEQKKYLTIADDNYGKKVKRDRNEPIPWQKIHDELYPQ